MAKDTATHDDVDSEQENAVRVGATRMQPWNIRRGLL